MSKFGDEAADYSLQLKGLSKTGLAWLCEDAEGDEVWLPISACDFPGGCKAGQVVEVTVPNWLAEEKGLI